MKGDMTAQVLTVTLNPAVDQTLTIRDFTTGEVNRVAGVRSKAGGKGVNVAAALAGYGVGVAATGFLGRENAAVFEEFLSERCIADRFVRLDGRTRTGIKINDPEREETTDINFPGLAPKPSDLDTLCERVIESSDRGGLWVVFAGSAPPGVDPGIYRELISLVHDRGCKTVLDTSGEPLSLALDAAPKIIKPNIHELEHLVGRRLASHNEVIEAARKVVSRGVELVVVSLGADGALFVSSNEVITARPSRVSVNSTVGAGDALVAGVIAGHIENLPLADCARLATAFSMSALTGDGSDACSEHAIKLAADSVILQ